MSQLDKIDHIVVLMLENRSFDHMLGYLTLAGRTDVDGLDGGHRNKGLDEVWYPSRQAPGTLFLDDPNHDWENVSDQLANGNSGFVVDFNDLTHGQDDRKESVGRVMDYHTADQVPVFDYLAREYCISDRWFASVPGPTQPNRMYAFAGTSNGIKNNLPDRDLIFSGWRVKPIFRYLPPNVSWRCYSYDISTLRFISGYRGFVSEIDKIYRFFDAARKGRLPNVTWIDPHFDLLWGYYPGKGNDDHPPHDVRNGQRLVRDVYNALVESPQWEKTLLVVLYDEHGGFFDHVSPDDFTAEDDYQEFRRYGVRVPALIVSPLVGKGICYGRDTGHVFDHTSVLKTIWNRFCRDVDPGMGARVRAATDLSVMLTEPEPRRGQPFALDALDLDPVRSAIRDLGFDKALGAEELTSTEAEMLIYREALEVHRSDNVRRKHLLDDIQLDAIKADIDHKMMSTTEPLSPVTSELQASLRSLAASIHTVNDDATVPLNKL